MQRKTDNAELLSDGFASASTACHDLILHLLERLPRPMSNGAADTEILSHSRSPGEMHGERLPSISFVLGTGF